jgi:hypothetical protein
MKVHNNTLFNSLDSEIKDTKNKATLTQKISWAEVQTIGLNLKQKDYILSFLKLNTFPLCCRDLEVITGIRTSSLTRVLNDLKNEQLIIVAKLDKSNHSKKLVEYYQISTSI